MEISINIMAEYFNVAVAIKTNEDCISLHKSFQGAYATYAHYAFIIPKIQFPALWFTIPQDKRLAVAEFVTRSNEYFMIGNFNLNMDQGIVRFAASVPFKGNDLSID